jgi:kojibiose phosphorylase
MVTEAEFDPARLHHQETVFTLSNGYLGTRGSFEEGYPGDRPATLIHGVYDAVPIHHTELANCPDWLSLEVRVDGERFRLDRGEVLGYRRRLDLRRGVLRREVRWRSPGGRTLDLDYERFASMADPHALALRCRVTSVDFEGEVQVRAGLDGHVDNQGFVHWEWLDQGEVPGPGSPAPGPGVWLHSRTRESGIEVGMAARLAAEGAGDLRAGTQDCAANPSMELTGRLGPGQTLAVEKVVSVYTSRDIEAPARAARENLAGLPGYAALLAAHTVAWADAWAAGDVVVEGDPLVQLAVRYNLFQLLAVAPRQDERVSIPAKALAGFAYRGHVFWDTDIFVVPCLAYTQPALARNLLMYRYHNLPGARRKAQARGHAGALFAWESAGAGDEVTPRWVPDAATGELVRIWCGDIELHINVDVAYAVWTYWQVAGDDDFMRRYGAEIILATAVYWGSRAEWNAGRGRYEISDVIGPDEYHDHVDNNAFTNRMVRWHLETALEALAWLRRAVPERAAGLERRLDLGRERLDHWAGVIDDLYVPHDPETGLMEQFEGFFELPDVDMAAYEPRTRSMQAILGIQGANQRQVIKQPDVLMLLYLLGDAYDRETLRVNWDYYSPRTDHTYGSSLGPAIHAILACRLGRPEEAYAHFMRAALVDLEDVRGNAAEGIHAGSAGAVWQAAVFGFGGLRLAGDGPVAEACLPPGWTRLRFRVQYRGRWYDFDLAPREAASRPAPDLRGVIFDLDGVLTDTSEFHYLGWQRLADEEGIPFDRAANEALRGLSRRDSLLHMLAGREVPQEDLQAMMARKNRYYQEFIEQVTPANLLPGALRLLEELRRAGIKIGIGSASKNARRVIERLGIVELVDAVADGYSVERHKPAPDLFLHAAQQLGLEPRQCLVVEDAASGVQAGLAAGMWVVGLGPPERVGEAHLALPDLAGAHWRDIQTRLAEAGTQA